MRKIVSGLFISLDGVFESPHEWHFPYWSDEMGAAIQKQMAVSDALLLGRVGFQEFAQFWPQQPSDGDIADYMNGTPKYVVSNTIDSVAEWQNSTLICGDVMAEVRALKEQPGQTIGMSGSGMLVRSLLAEGLLDELRLLVHPVVVGKGKRLFPDGTPHLGLALTESEALPNGVMALTYVKAKN